jgi:hypothetical protein
MSGSIQLGIAVALILMIAALTLSFALSAGRTGAEPIIRASFKQLQTDWYQVGMTVTNRAPYRLVGESLRRVRPGSARLMAPISSVSTRQGNFQVWSDPALDLATTSIPIDMVVGPHEAWRGSVSPGSEAHLTAWVFLPEKAEPTQLTLEFTFKDGGGNLRRYRFIATREP